VIQDWEQQTSLKASLVWAPTEEREKPEICIPPSNFEKKKKKSELKKEITYQMLIQEVKIIF
jgi:hypothetical protein